MMELKDATFDSWLLRFYKPPESNNWSAQDAIDKCMNAEGLKKTTPEMAIRLSVCKVRHEWSSFRKRTLFGSVHIVVQYAIAKTNYHRSVDEDEFQDMDNYLNDAKEDYAKWVVNHPGIKALWTEINAQYPEKRTAVEELQATFMREMRR
jgi:hypothetical protein